MNIPVISTRSRGLFLPFLFSWLAVATGCQEGPAEPRGFEEVPDHSVWLKENGYALMSLTSSDYEDLQFLKTTIGDRRLVQLGESGHGVAEFNQAKVRLIKFLHEEMGFGVIAFESGMYEAFRTERGADTLNALDLMRNSIYSVWWTTEVLSLFEYIKSTHGTEQPLRVAGFDMRPRTALGPSTRPAFLGSVVGIQDEEYGREVAKLEGDFVNLNSFPRWFDSLSAHSTRLREGYTELAGFFEAHDEEIAEAFFPDTLLPLVAAQIARNNLNRIDMAETWLTQCGGTESRDQAMADNLTVLLDQAYPNEKIITWAHNSHIRHRNQEAHTLAPCPTMGGTTAERHREELYTVGLYMYGGSAADHYKDVYPIEPAEPGTLEGYLNQAGHPFFFLDLLSQDPGSAPAFLFGTTPVRTWGRITERIVPKDQYDAILQIKWVDPPEYVYD